MAEDIGSILRDGKGRFSSVTPTEKAQTDPAPEKVVETPAVVEPVVEAAPVPAPAPAPPAPVVSNEAEAYKTAMREEREKRQRAEARLRELEKPVAQIDPYTDLPGALKSQSLQFAEQLFIERCNITEEIQRGAHTDYDETRDAFLEAANENPALMAQMRQERNPAAYAYREGKRIRELKEVGGDFTAYRSKIEKDADARAEARVRAEYKAQGILPKSLNDDSSPPQPAETFTGPTPLKAALRNAK
jgi:hypothetical protein